MSRGLVLEGSAVGKTQALFLSFLRTQFLNVQSSTIEQQHDLPLQLRASSTDVWNISASRRPTSSWKQSATAKPRECIQLRSGSLAAAERSTTQGRPTLA